MKTQRTNALTPDILTDCSQSGLSRKQRRNLNMVAHARFKRLGTCTDSISKDKYNSKDTGYRDKLLGKYDNRTFSVSQIRNLNSVPYVKEFASDTWKDTEFIYKTDRHLLDKQQRKRGKN